MKLKNLTIRKILNKYFVMNRKKPESDLKVCKRCNRHHTKDIICPSCKNELLSSYDNRIDWRTAYEVEQAHQLATKYRMRGNY